MTANRTRIVVMVCLMLVISAGVAVAATGSGTQSMSHGVQMMHGVNGLLLKWNRGLLGLFIKKLIIFLFVGVYAVNAYLDQVKSHSVTPWVHLAFGTAIFLIVMGAWYAALPH